MPSWTVSTSDRLDRFLRQHHPTLSRSSIKRWLKQGDIRVNGRKARGGHLLQPGDEVQTPTLPVTENGSPAPASHLKLNILYEDRDILACDKPAGLPCHPMHPWDSESVVQGLLATHEELHGVGETRAPGLLHRLDNLTSGVLLFAKTPSTYERLSEALRARQWHKQYLAWVHGLMTEEQSVSWPIAHHPSDARRMLTWHPDQAPPKHRGHPQEAITHLLPVGSAAIPSLEGTGVQMMTLMSIVIETGVRHQIRAHLAGVGHPVVGDPLYPMPSQEPRKETTTSSQEARAPWPRMYLHASLLAVPTLGPKNEQEIVSPCDFGDFPPQAQPQQENPGSPTESTSTA